MTEITVIRWNWDDTENRQQNGTIANHIINILAQESAQAAV